MARVAWFAEEQVVNAVRLEPAVVILVVAFLSWLSYKFFLGAVSAERHRLLRGYFKNLLGHLLFGSLLFATFNFMKLAEENGFPRHIAPYVGLVAIASACVILVKILRILAFEFLFLGSMKAGVPALIVNILSLLVSLIMGGWYINRFFSVDLTPLLATSAIFSIVLGLALQDTLGNLFAAISLQFDKPFGIGDWIEVRNGGDRIAGQVLEISWRATVLVAVTDELIVIPNRTMAQREILNFSGRNRPFIRSHTFRIPFGASIEKAKEALLKTVGDTRGIEKEPGPVVIVSETTESWVALKVVYYLTDYGLQYGIADRYLSRALLELERAGIELASSRIRIDAPERSA